AELFSIVSGFDAAYAAYNAHQAGMERFWTLKYLLQEGLEELVGTVFKEGFVRADDLPLVLPVMGGADLPRGARVRLKLGEIDLITLDVKGTFVERLDVAPAPLDALEEEAEDEPVAGPIAIAVDVNDTEETSAATIDSPAS
ncbi:MAG TPA: RNB domain-containing ribonuclease, partial [Ramlibacter sp.]